MSLTRDDLADIKHLMEVTINAAFKEHNKELDRRFEEVDRRFEEVDKRFDEIYERFDEADIKMNTILDAIGTEFNDQQETIDDHEVRIVRLEKKAA